MNVHAPQARGFTIVELLIVIVVIGILASIVIVAFNGIQARAQNTARFTELKSWQKAFDNYRANSETNQYPGPVDGSIQCLGTGFPSSPASGNVPRCWSYHDTSFSWLQSDNTTVMNELKRVTRVSQTSRTPIDNALVGPIAIYNPSEILLYTAVSGANAASNCTSGTTHVSSLGGTSFTVCGVTLTR